MAPYIATESCGVCDYNADGEDENELEEMAAGDITGRGGAMRGEEERRGQWEGGEGMRAEEGRKLEDGVTRISFQGPLPRYTVHEPFYNIGTLLCGQQRPRRKRCLYISCVLGYYLAAAVSLPQLYQPRR